jgi:signal transduction histidine kinase
VQAWLTTMFERHGSRYVIGSFAALMAELALVVSPAIGVFPSHYEGLTIGRYLLQVVAGIVIALILFQAIVVGVRRRAPSLLIWSDTRADEHAAAAATFAFKAPRRVGVLVMSLGVPFAVLSVVLVAPRPVTATDVVELAIGSLMSVLLAALNAWFMLDVLLRPVRASFERPPADAKRSSLVARLAIGVPATVWFSSVAVGYLATTRVQAGSGHLLRVYAIAVACALFTMVLTAPLFVGGVAGPIRDLARTARDVAAGKIRARVRVASTDELGRLGESLNEMLDQLQESRARIVAASDSARRKVERDLHDGAQQRLVLAQLKLGTLQRQIAADPQSAAQSASELHEELAGALAELRDLARGLYPPLLESDGLPGALTDAAARSPIPTTVDLDSAGRYSPELEAAVYFCCLEALQNAAKYAGEAARACVTLASSDQELTFAVTDDGAGFDPSTVNGSSGLQNIADRIGALGGSVRIESTPGHGTRVAGAVPLTTEG